VILVCRLVAIDYRSNNRSNNIDQNDSNNNQSCFAFGVVINASRNLRLEASFPITVAASDILTLMIFSQSVWIWPYYFPLAVGHGHWCCCHYEVVVGRQLSFYLLSLMVAALKSGSSFQSITNHSPIDFDF